jgi:hypothetical protein
MVDFCKYQVLFGKREEMFQSCFNASKRDFLWGKNPVVRG